MISNDVLNFTNNAYITYDNYNSVIVFYTIIKLYCSRMRPQKIQYL